MFLYLQFGDKYMRLFKRRKPNDLTNREIDVMECLAEGMGTDEISEKLFISPMTTRTHLKNIFQKLGIHSRVEAALIAKDAIEKE